MAAVTIKAFYKSLLHLLGGSNEPSPADKWAALDEETQMQIATEVGLMAAVEMIVLQRAAWNELVDNLAETGVSISISPEMAHTYGEVTQRLNASMRVVAEAIGIDGETLREIGL